MICDYAHDDGAYVLGALTPPERAAFEAHLTDCPPCRGAVAELAALPGLLARLDAGNAERLPGAGPEPLHADSAERPVPAADGTDSTRLPRLLRAAAGERRRERIRRRWRIAAAGLAAACLAALVGVGVAAIQGGLDDRAAREAPVAVAPMVPMVPADGGSAGPVTAEIALTPAPGGTRIRMHCAYSQVRYGGEPWTFRLVAYGAGGEVEPVGSWRAGPGEELTVDGMVRLAPGELDRIEVQLGDGRRLLVYAVA